MGGRRGNVASGRTLLPTRPPSLHPGPAHPVFLSRSCWQGVNIPGWVSEICAPSHYTAAAPPPTPALAPARHKSQTLSNSPLHPQADQEVAVHRAHTSPGAPQVPPPPPPLAPSSAAQGRARGSPRGKGPPAPQPRLPGPRRPAGSGPHAAYLKAGTGPPTFLLRIANRTAGEGPPAGHSSASAALAESPGPNVRRGRTGGWLFFGGGGLILSDSLGRTGCLRAGAGQMLYF